MPGTGPVRSNIYSYLIPLVVLLHINDVTMMHVPLFSQC